MWQNSKCALACTGPGPSSSKTQNKPRTRTRCIHYGNGTGRRCDATRNDAIRYDTRCGAMRCCIPQTARSPTMIMLVCWPYVATCWPTLGGNLSRWAIVPSSSSFITRPLAWKVHYSRSLGWCWVVFLCFYAHHNRQWQSRKMQITDPWCIMCNVQCTMRM